jgi:TorA maturation chaperone TorD
MGVLGAAGDRPMSAPPTRQDADAAVGARGPDAPVEAHAPDAVEGHGSDAAVDAAVGRALARASVYRLLGAAFADPARSRLDALAGSAEAAAVGAAELAEPLRALAAAAREADPAALAEERVFLFDRGSRCPPYEGAWDDAPQLAGKAALLADIAGFLAAFGLAPARACPDVEDHVAAECELMSVLALKEACALAEGRREGLDVTRRAQQSFLSDHLGRWAAAFAAALREATPLPYYGALADALDHWVDIDAAGLGVAPARVAGRGAPDPVQEDAAFTCPMAAAGGADEPA